MNQELELLAAPSWAIKIHAGKPRILKTTEVTRSPDMSVCFPYMVTGGTHIRYFAPSVTVASKQ